MRLPTTTADGTLGMLKLADEVGAQEVFLMTRMLRTRRGRGVAVDVGQEVMRLLAVRLVEAEMANSNVDWRTARTTVGRRLGYSPAGESATMTNFYKILGDEQRVPDSRPSSRYRA
jgi:hypothetical protein